MAGNKTVLTDHDRKHDILMLGNPERLDHVVVGFLIALCIDLQPAGIPLGHGVGVVGIEDPGSEHTPVHVDHDHGQTSTGGHVQDLMHVQ